MHPLVRSREAGQSLLIAVLIASLLFLAVPVIVYLTINRVHHRTGVVKRDKATATAELGLEYAKRILTNNAVWVKPITAANLVPIADCNSNRDILAADGGHFRLTCSIPGPGCPLCQPYQIYVRSTAYMPSADGTIGGDPNRAVPYTAIRAVEAHFSQKTLAATLNNGTNAPAVLETVSAPPNMSLMNFPPNMGNLYTYNGSIVSHDPTTVWSVRDYIDLCRQPRKFGPGAILGSSSPGTADPWYRRAPTVTDPHTDRKEYWAYTQVGFPSVIDVASYDASAINNLVDCNGNAPTCGLFPCPAPANSCYFDNLASGLPAVFDGGFALNNPTGVIVVTGNAIFRDVDINVSPLGGIIVKGNITLENNLATAYPYNVPVPPVSACNAALEEGDHPYLPPLNLLPLIASWPANYTVSCPAACNNLSRAAMNIQGFLYAMGDINIDLEPAVPGSNRWYGIYGAVRADGTVNFRSGTLELAYNANVNRNIRTATLELIKDRQAEVPVP